MGGNLGPGTDPKPDLDLGYIFRGFELPKWRRRGPKRIKNRSKIDNALPDNYDFDANWIFFADTFVPRQLSVRSRVRSSIQPNSVIF